MKKLKKLKRNIAAMIVAVFSVALGSCGDDSSEIERFKNEYRDPNLIGKWKMITDDNEYYIDIFNKAGEWETENKKPNGEKYKQFRYYYYTNGDRLYYLFPKTPLKGGGDSGFHFYSIKNDTLVFKHESDLYPTKYVRIAE